jgi:Flp pilus assembly protein TadG
MKRGTQPCCSNRRGTTVVETALVLPVVDVPGGGTIASLQSQMLAAFSQVAAKVPPAQLVHSN